MKITRPVTPAFSPVAVSVGSAPNSSRISARVAVRGNVTGYGSRPVSSSLARLSRRTRICSGRSSSGSVATGWSATGTPRITAGCLSRAYSRRHPIFFPDGTVPAPLVRPGGRSVRPDPAAVPGGGGPVDPGGRPGGCRERGGGPGRGDRHPDPPDRGAGLPRGPGGAGRRHARQGGPGGAGGYRRGDPAAGRLGRRRPGGPVLPLVRSPAGARRDRPGTQAGWDLRPDLE